MRDDNPFTFEAYARLRRRQLAEAVKQECERYGWSERQLADFLKWPPARLADIENGESGYSLEELEILAACFGVPLERLTGLSPAQEVLLHRALTTNVTRQALAKCVEIPLSADGLDLVMYHPVFVPHTSMLICSLPDDDRGQLLAWDTETGQVAWRYEHPTLIIGAPAFSPDGHSIAFATTQDTVIVLRASDTFGAQATRTPAAILDPVEQGLVDDEWWAFVDELDAGYGHIAALCFSPDGELLAAINEDTGTLRLWNTHTWQHQHTIYVAQLQEQALRRRHQNQETVSWKYGEVAVSGMRFTLDGQAIALWCRTSNQIDYFPLHGRSVETQLLAEAPGCYEEIPVLSRWGSSKAVLHPVGGMNQSLELWQTEQSSASVIHREQHLSGCIYALKVIDHQTMLAVIELCYDMCPMTVKNLVNNQVVVVAEEAQIQGATFSPDGGMLAYVAATGSQGQLALFIQHLDLSVLRDKRSLADFPWYEHDPASGDRLRESLPLGGNPNAQFADPQEVGASFTGWHEILEEEAHRHRPRFSLPLAGRLSLRDKLDYLEEFGLSANAQHDGIFVAFYAETPDLVLSVLAQDFEQKAGILTHLVDLALVHAEADQLASRDLAEAIVDRTLLRGEATPEVFQEIRDKHETHILVLDSAERLSTDSLVWLVSEARALVRMIFLIIQDERLFEERIEEYTEPGWLEGRMAFVSLNELEDDHSAH
ncbi:MAG: helix-turn-helix domain-containing protein [Aggregatilineales bacterium]